MLSFKLGPIVVLMFRVVDALSEGERCSKYSDTVICRHLYDCPAARKDLRNLLTPLVCSFDEKGAIVCCDESPSTTPITKEMVQRGNTSPFTSIRHPPYIQHRCLQYLRRTKKTVQMGSSIGYPSIRHPPILVRRPWTVLIIYQDNKCSGTIISDWFILTAAHCISDKNTAVGAYALLDALTTKDISRRYNIKRVVKHPDYESSSKYHDLALLETETQMTLDRFAWPACLYVGDDRNEKVTVTGWGPLHPGQRFNSLQKATMSKFSSQTCAKFPSGRYRRESFDESTQLCYGNSSNQDVCQGDDGSPLQIINKQIHCMYSVLGVASFTWTCRVNRVPGTYTRVAAYVPWIESIVWP